MSNGWLTKHHGYSLQKTARDPNQCEGVVGTCKYDNVDIDDDDDDYDDDDDDDDDDDVDDVENDDVEEGG